MGSDTPQDLIGTAFWAYDADLMSKIATALGKTERSAYYARLNEKIAGAFQAQFVHPDGSVGNGSQTSYVLALNMNLLSLGARAGAAKRLVADIQQHGDHLTTGFLGTPYLMPVLTETGHSDEAFRLLTQTTYPSWGYMIEHGATTMWERWNGDQMLSDAAMNSFNHYSYGSVAEWIYRYVAGIDSDASGPGFHAILLHPNFDAGLGDVESAYDSPYGRIRSDWKVEGDQIRWTVELPANTAALATIPGRDVSLADGEGTASQVCSAQAAQGVTICKLVSGTYHLLVSKSSR